MTRPPLVWLRDDPSTGELELVAVGKGQEVVVPVTPRTALRLLISLARFLGEILPREMTRPPPS